MNSLDPFLVPFVLGAVLGFARIAPMLLKAAAVLSVAAIAWTWYAHGAEVLNRFILTTLPNLVVPHAPAIGAALIGLILGSAVARLMPPRPS